MTKQSTVYDTGKIYRVLSLVIVLMCFGLAIWAYPHLPDKVPSHWNLAGKVNRYSGRLTCPACGHRGMMPTVNDEK